MLYIIAILNNNHDKTTSYRAFDAYSHSLITLKEELLINIILNTKIQVVNASIQNNKIVIKNWTNSLTTERSEYNGNAILQSAHKLVIIAKRNDTYKIVEHTGRVKYLKAEELKSIVQARPIANCSFKKVKRDIQLKTEDTYDILEDPKFEKLIRSKYDTFIAKTTMLGRKGMTFNYEIENDEVRLIKYTGSSNDIIIPSFITVIAKDAFRFNTLKRINLNEGLKAIGTGAFITASSSDSLDRLEIPSTVELIGEGAFYGNDKLFNSEYNPNTDRFKLRNNKTIILEQHII